MNESGCDIISLSGECAFGKDEDLIFLTTFEVSRHLLFAYMNITLFQNHRMLNSSGIVLTVSIFINQETTRHCIANCSVAEFSSEM